MKRILIPLLGTAVLLAGCIVTSVYPFYTAKDVAFDPALIGKWSEPDKTNSDRETWTFEKLGDKAYTLTVIEKDSTNQFDVHRFTLKGTVFLDCFSRNRAPYTIPSHVLLRVAATEPRLEMYPLSYDWLGKLLEQHPKAIRHVMLPKAGEPDKNELIVLTADTAELQKFVLKHLKSTNAWDDVVIRIRE